MNLSTVDAFKNISAANNPIELNGERLGSLQRVLTRMLGDLNEVCERHGIAYTLGGGTCLGAVRHHGFIPWDDDVDINMTREGYRRFVKAYESEMKDGYWLHDCNRTPGYELAFPRLRLKGTVVRSREDYQFDECGAYIDIFIIDNAPSNALLRNAHGFISMALGFAYSCRRFAAHAADYLALVEGDAAATSAFKKKILIGRLLSFRSVESWTRAWDRWNSRCHDASSSHVTIPVGRKHYFGELQFRSDYFPVSRGSFGDLTVPLPKNTDAYMRSLYGEGYMTPPPEGDREKHVVYEFDLGDFENDVWRAEEVNGR